MLVPLASFLLALFVPVQGLRLEGVVQRDDGGPLEGASVFVATAQPRHGPALLCSSCYRDCRKGTVTDAKGHFALEGLDPELLFQLLVVAEEHAPLFTERNVDPSGGEVVLRLETRRLADHPREKVLRGRVVDDHGNPVRNAKLAPLGRKLDNGGLQYGAIGADEAAVTDADGRFGLLVDEPRMVTLLRVSARAFAPRMSPWFTAGADGNTLTLVRGASVTGRVEREGKPVAGVVMGLVQVNRSAEVYLGEDTIATDAAGRFTFVNVAPGDAYSLYGKAESCAQFGAIPVRTIAVGADESTFDAGVVQVEPSVRLAGRVVTADGSALLADTRLVLNREDALDSMMTTVAADGTFAFAAPRELIALAPPGSGAQYRVSPENASFDFLNGAGLIGRLERDTELVLLLEPGPSNFEIPDIDRAAFTETWARYQELQRLPPRGWAGKSAGTAR